MLGASMAVRAPRSRGLMQMAIDAIRRNNGTLLMVPDNLAGAFIDSTGTQPVSTVGDVLGLLTDRSYGTSNLGPNLVSNGTFDSGTTGWSTAGSPTFTVSSGAASVARTAFGDLVFQAVSCVVGRSYQVTATVTAAPSSTARVGFSASVVGGAAEVLNSGGVGTYRAIVVATSTTMNVVLTTAANATSASFDNISVREVLGNHASQPTTANKPVIARVPKRLGPELSSYASGFSSTTGISVVGATVSVVSNELVITSTSTNGSDRGEIPVSGLVIGRSYSATVVARRGAQGTDQTIRTWTGGEVSPALTRITTTTATPYTVRFVATAESGIARVYSQDAAGAVGDSVIVSSISIQEVLEWTNAISFDGSNDSLTTTITTGNEGWVCAGVTFGGAAGAGETVFGSGATNTTVKGVWLARVGSAAENQLWLATGNGSTRHVAVKSDVALRNTPRVVEGGWNASTCFVAVDGVATSTARSGDMTPPVFTQASVGQVSNGSYLQGPMPALVYTPVLPSEADRALIRRWIGSLQGQTL